MNRKAVSGIKLTLLLLGMLALYGRSIHACLPLPDVLWDYSASGDHVNCLKAIKDINGDGKQDVIVGSIYNFGVSCFSGDTGTPLWSQFVEGWVLSLALIEDVDNDGKQDIVAGTDYPDPGIKCLSGLTGTTLWSYSTLTSLYMYAGMHNGVTSVCAINAVNGDGWKGVVAATEGSEILCVDGKNGSLIWSHIFNGYVRTVLNVGDVDNDGKQDVVVVLRRLLEDNRFGTYCFSGGNGTIIWSWVDNGEASGGSVIDDVDQDLMKDIVIGVNWTHVICISGSSGSSVWMYLLPPKHFVDVMKGIDDVNADGKPEVVVGGGEKIVCISGLGEFVWSYHAPGEVQALDSIDDIDGDGRSEIIAGTYGYQGALGKDETLCISGGSSGIGKLIWSYTMSDGASGVSGIDDVDGDGKQDVIIGTLERDGKVHMVSGGSKDTGNLIWSRHCGSMVWSLMLISDVDDDGKPDVVAYSLDGRTHCISGANGSLLWSTSSSAFFHVIDDVDEDDKPEVLIRSDDELLCLSGDKGTAIWSQTLSHGILYVLNIDDIDSDGKRDILLVTWMYPEIPEFPMRWLYDINCMSGSDGVTIWSFNANMTVPPSYLPIPIPKVVDVNGDDKSDVILTTSWLDKYYKYHHELLCIDGNSTGVGTQLWRKETPAEIRDLLVVRDANYDNISDVVVATTDSKILSFSGSTGALIWTYQAETALELIFSIEDVGSDSIQDIVAHNGIPLNKTFCISGGNGTLIWSYTTNYPALGHWSSDLYKTYTIDDVNGDGKQEVLLRTGYPDDALYCISGGDGVPIWTTKLGRNIRFFDVTGDVNRDNLPDILVGATNRTAYCVSGRDGSILWKFLGQGYVTGMWQTDDLNGDGMKDFFVASGKIYALASEPTIDTTPPLVTLLSPENVTYVASFVLSTITVNEPTSWIGYSLDGQANVTIAGSTTLTNLSYGVHNITSYAQDTSGNMGCSSTVYFTVAPLGDLNGDGIVDVTDIYIVAETFGSYPSHPEWNPKADMDQDGMVDIRDIYLIAVNFGKTIDH